MKFRTRIPVPAVLSALCVAALAPGSHPVHAQAENSATWRAQIVEITDRRGFEKPMPAMTIMVPAGWRAQGEIQWGALSCARSHQPTLQARSPDGRSAIEITAGEAWTAGGPAPSVPCQRASFSTAESYLKAWVARYRPSAQWLDYRIRPERGQPPRDMPFMGGGTRSWVEVGQALIGYEQGGQAVRESLAVAIAFAATRMALPGMPPVQTMQGESFGVLSWRAPEGQLDFRQFDAMWQTLRSDERWQARIDQGTQATNQAIARDNAITAGKVAAIHAETSRQTLEAIKQRGEIARTSREEVAAINNGTVRDRAASNERMHTDSVRSVREVSLYRGSSIGGSGTVELPNHYQHAWRLRDGTYVLTDSPNFDPNRDLGVPGEQLKRTR
jgi:hypothetical protein